MTITQTQKAYLYRALALYALKSPYFLTVIGYTTHGHMIFSARVPASAILERCTQFMLQNPSIHTLQIVGKGGQFVLTQNDI